MEQPQLKKMDKPQTIAIEKRPNCSPNSHPKSPLLGAENLSNKENWHELGGFATNDHQKIVPQGEASGDSPERVVSQERDARRGTTTTSKQKLLTLSICHAREQPTTTTTTTTTGSSRRVSQVLSELRGGELGISGERKHLGAVCSRGSRTRGEKESAPATTNQVSSGESPLESAARSQSSGAHKQPSSSAHLSTTMETLPRQPIIGHNDPLAPTCCCQQAKQQNHVDCWQHEKRLPNGGQENGASMSKRRPIGQTNTHTTRPRTHKTSSLSSSSSSSLQPLAKNHNDHQLDGHRFHQIHHHDGQIIHHHLVRNIQSQSSTNFALPIQRLSDCQITSHFPLHHNDEPTTVPIHTDPKQSEGHKAICRHQQQQQTSSREQTEPEFKNLDKLRELCSLWNRASTSGEEAIRNNNCGDNDNNEQEDYITFSNSRLKRRRTSSNDACEHSIDKLDEAKLEFPQASKKKQNETSSSSSSRQSSICHHQQQQQQQQHYHNEATTRRRERNARRKSTRTTTTRTTMTRTTTKSTSYLLFACAFLSLIISHCDSQFISQPPLANSGALIQAAPSNEEPLVTNEIAFVDLRIKENSIQHHTILYEQIDHINPLNPTGPSIVLRRGEYFNIILHLRHNYNKQTDKIRLEFSYGPRPQVGKGTLIYLPITKDRDSFGRDPSKWDARVVRVDGNQLSVQINLPANIAVGVWRFRVSTKLAGSRTIRTYTVKEALYIIFNAWSKDDAVYLSREDARQEYVLNDVGKIYIGSHSKPRGRKWIYGQFHESVLPAVMFMLDKTRLDINGRANVVKVARAVSAMVNSHDDNGLLVGNWSGNYGDGLAPWQWTGSATILEKYLQSGGEPVKFGQCWVFAGVTTTALRTLGIPARTVSNFVSAHDTDDSLTVDKFFSEKGDSISDVNSDSIWNFHVWSDAWMARTDLPPGYGGWQAVDATPQETSMGMYQMGPASLEAIKKGEVGFAYDAAFVFAEVNADIVHWQQDDKSELQWKKIKTLKFHIGRKIFTKMIGQLDDYTANGVADAEDIISQYKNKEGTEDERMSVLNAARCGGLGFLFEQPAPGKEDVEFELFDIDKVMLGDTFLITVRIVNKSPMRRTVSLAMSASSVYYTGILAQKVKRDRQNIILNPLQEQLIRVRVNPEDYMERLVDYSMMKVYAIATVKETQQTWSKEDDFLIEKVPL